MTLEPREYSIVGESYGDRQQIICDHVRAGSSFILRREPKNQHDPNAIAITVPTPLGFQQIGYLGRSDAAWLAPKIDAGLAIPGCIAGVYGGTEKYPLFGVRIALYFEDGSTEEEYDGPPRPPLPPLVTPIPSPNQPADTFLYDLGRLLSSPINAFRHAFAVDKNFRTFIAFLSILTLLFLITLYLAQ